MKFKLFAAGFGMIAAAPAAAAWQEASSRHFIVYADDTPQNVAAYATKLERFDKALRASRGTPDDVVSPLSRVTVFVVPSIRDVQRLSGRGSGDVAGFYIPRSSDTVAFVPRRSGDEDMTSMTILLHEYSHHFMFSNYGRAAFPAWLVEGWAEFNSTAIFNGDGSVLFGGAANHRGFGIRDNWMVPAVKLLTVSPSQLRSEEERGVFYARSWLLTHYMTMDAGRRGQLAAYFSAINSGKPTAEAADVLGDPYKLDSALNTYVSRSHLTGFTVAAARLAIEPVQVRTLTPGQAAIMPARIASSRGVDAKSAPVVAELAQRLAAPYPADAAVQNELAEAEYDAGNYSAAQAAADRALAADPKSIRAMLYQGMIRSAVAAKAKSTEPATWAEVRRWYVKANRLDPEYAFPLELFYGSYGLAKQAPSVSAQEGLLYAHALAPFDLGLGMQAAHVLLMQDKPAEAKTALKPIAYNPHAGGLALAAAALIVALDKDGAAGALKLIEANGGEGSKDAQGSKKN